MTGANADAFAELLEEYRQRWIEDDYHALSEAVLLCHWNAVAMPEWMAEALLEELEASFSEIGPRARGLGRGRRDRLRRREIQQQRAAAAALHLSKMFGPMTRREAFEAASEDLKRTPAQGTPEQIEKAHDAEVRVSRLRRKAENT
jgi:hypothetical protein